MHEVPWLLYSIAMQGEKMFALEEWVELANGCLCCSLKDDFLRALEALMEQRQRFDYILVETTGALFGVIHVMIRHAYPAQL